MKVLIDTNVLLSAALFPGGRAAQAYRRAIAPPFQPLICDYIVEELLRTTRRKFPERMADMEAFLFYALARIRTVPMPDEPVREEAAVRDPKDRPILRAALDAGSDLLLTGDKDLLEASVTDPRIVSVAEFLDL